MFAATFSTRVLVVGCERKSRNNERQHRSTHCHHCKGPFVCPSVPLSLGLFVPLSLCLSVSLLLSVPAICFCWRLTVCRVLTCVQFAAASAAAPASEASKHLQLSKDVVQASAQTGAVNDASVHSPAVCVCVSLSLSLCPPHLFVERQPWSRPHCCVHCGDGPCCRTSRPWRLCGPGPPVQAAVAAVTCAAQRNRPRRRGLPGRLHGAHPAHQHVFCHNPAGRRGGGRRQHHLRPDTQRRHAHAGARVRRFSGRPQVRAPVPRRAGAVMAGSPQQTAGRPPVH